MTTNIEPTSTVFTTNILADVIEKLSQRHYPKNSRGVLLMVAQRLRELDKQVKQQINDYGRGMAVADLTPKPDCVWANGGSDEDFETQCGNTFTFIDGGIKENDCKFCQYCSGAVKDKSNEG